MSVYCGMQTKKDTTNSQPMNIGDIFEIAPKSESTIVRHSYIWNGYQFINDMGLPCDYRIVKNDIELGIIKYYRGRLLTCYQVS